MGVIAVNVMQHPAFQQDLLYAGDDHHPQCFNSYSNTTRFTHRRQRRLFKQAPWPRLLCNSRRLHLHRSSFTIISPLALKRHISISVSAPSCLSEPAAAQLLQVPLKLQCESSPAPASGMQTQILQPDRRSIAGYHQASNDDLGLDYKEAAAALEQLFTESPSLQDERNGDGDSGLGQEVGSLMLPGLQATVSQSSASTKRHRKDLMTRITLRRKKMKEPCDHEVQAAGKRSGAAVKLSADSIWSAAASKLLQQHGEAVNLMAQNWSKLKGELLSMEEERWLAFLLKPAKALKKVRDSLRQQLGREPSDEEWAHVGKMEVPTLYRHLALHQAARNKLVKMNLRLVRHQARKYERDAVGSSLTVVELCQEGVKGLIVAVDRFDPTKGVRFSTYAMFWIRNSILRAQTRSGYPIRAPFNFAQIKMNINKTKWEMRLEAGEMVEQKAGGSLMKRMLERVGVDEERYRLVMRSNPKVVSLHKRDPVTGTELIEHLADPNSHHDVISGYLGGDIGATDPTLRLGIDDVLDSLKPKESLVLRQRFGLDGKGERALGEIGRNMRISREMVRRYEARGLLKLKHPTRLAYLRSLLSQDS